MGALAKCPRCGRLGEVIIGQYAECPVCDSGAAPDWVEPEKTVCLHLETATYSMFGYITRLCANCGVKM